MRWFTVDLHIHTCLSPCGDLMMSPKKIIANVLRQQIDVIAITDHNSAENVSAVGNAAEGTGLVVLPGMEVCTSEEAHVLAIFDNVHAVMTLQDLVYRHLHGENDAEVFGDQVIANENDEVEGFQQKLLIGATDLSVDRVVSEIHRLNGLAIASHVDRESFSVIGQLGFIPESLTFDALEISTNTSTEEAKGRFSTYRQYPLIRNSDAHFLNQIGQQTTRYWLDKPTMGEIGKALRNEDGRLFEMTLE